MAGSIPAFPGQCLSWFSSFSQSVSRQCGSQTWKPIGAASTLALGVSWTILKAPFMAEKNAAWEAGLRDFLTEAFLPFEPIYHSSFASVSVSAAAESMEPQTGVVFARESAEGDSLIGIGLRKKSILGLKSITVYAYGVYADADSVMSSLGSKYRAYTPEELSNKEELFGDVTKSDVGLGVRLVIVYGKLKIGSIRSAFEESIGKNLKKISGSDNKELLHRFTSLFTDDLKLPKGTAIDLTRRPGQVLDIKIDGQAIGKVQSALLCEALFDLYIGEDAFDKNARKSIGESLASFISSQRS